jgi:hypothetical protein
LGKPLWVRPPSSSSLGLRISGITSSDGVGSGFTSLNDGESILGGSANRFLESWVKTAKIKGHNNYTDSEWVQTTQGVTTVGTSLIAAFQKTLAVNTSIRVKITAVSRSNTAILSPEAQSAFSLEAVFAREAGGALLIGAPITNVIGMSVDSYEHTLAVGVTGNDLVIYVAGGTGQTCNWALAIDYQIVATGA